MWCGPLVTVDPEPCSYRTPVHPRHIPGLSGRTGRNIFRYMGPRGTTGAQLSTHRDADHAHTGAQTCRHTQRRDPDPERCLGRRAGGTLVWVLSAGPGARAREPTGESRTSPAPAPGTAGPPVYRSQDGPCRLPGYLDTADEAVHPEGLDALPQVPAPRVGVDPRRVARQGSPSRKDGRLATGP